MGHLSLSLLGPFQATLDGQPVTGFESQKVRALLAYLAVEADRPHARAALAGLLWPDWPDREALSNLRYALSHLRQAIGDRQAAPPFLLITHDTIQFNPASDYTLDVKTFSDQCSAFNLQALAPRLPPFPVSQLQSAATLYRDIFLDGFSIGGSPAFEEWVLYKREQLGQQVLAALRTLTAYYEEEGHFEPAQFYARRQLELEPWDETAHQQLMRALAFSGQRSAALAQYERCRRLLAEALKVEPSPETTSLYEYIRTGKLNQGPGKYREEKPRVTSPPFLAAGGPALGTRPLFVARERELARLDEFLALALAGQGRVVFVTGEPGSGKTVLVQAFIRWAMGRHDDLIVAWGNGNAHTGIGDPYLPFLETMQMLTGEIEPRWTGGTISQDHARRLWQLLPATAQALTEAGADLIDRFVPGVALLARAQAYIQWFGDLRRDETWLTPLGELVRRKTALTGSVGPVNIQQVALFEQFTRVLQLLALRHPLILVLDDLQWADAGSISLLFHLGRHLVGSRILVVGAYRPDELAQGYPAPLPSPGLTGQPYRHPLEAVVNEFQRDWGNIQVELAQAEGREFVEVFLDSEPNLLNAVFREALYRHTEGNALFTVELLRGLQERGDLRRDTSGRWVAAPALDWDRLPARVEAVIAERFGRLPETWQATLAVASVEGEEFTAEAVARVRGVDETEVIQHLSGELARQHRLVKAVSLQRLDGQTLSRYRFRHYLFQKYLYQHLDEVERPRLHEAVGQALEALYGEQIGEIAVALAYHFERAGRIDRAVDYLLQAGLRAIRLLAHPEAMTHLTHGLELLNSRPRSSDHDRQELALQVALAIPIEVTKGYATPELGQLYARVWELCQHIGEAPGLSPIRLKVWNFHLVRAEHQMACQLAEQVLHRAQQAQDSLQITLAQSALGLSRSYLGEFGVAHRHFELVIASYNPQQYHSLVFSLIGQDIGVTSLAWDACSLWLLGYPEQALVRSQAALALAQELGHPFTLAYAQAVAGAYFHRLCRRGQAAQEFAEMVTKLATEKGFGLILAIGTIALGRVQAEAGQFDQGIALMRQGLTAYRAVMQTHFPDLQAWLVEAYLNTGQVTAGLKVLSEALAFVDRTGERFYEAELYRLKGELLLGQADQFEAEASFRQAIEVARRQQAKSWELRATISMARLWRQQGKTFAARQILADIYSWFTEGFDTTDIQEAKVLLRELSPSADSNL